MFPIKLFPLFIIGCATVPTIDGEVESKPTNDPNVDPADDSADDSIDDRTADPIADPIADLIADPTDDRTVDLFADPIVDPTDDRADEPFQSDDFESMDSMEIRSAIHADIEVLHNLQIVEVGDVLLDLPGEAVCAYNWTPCPGFDDEIDDALREVGPRLDALVHFAQLAAAEAVTPDADTCTDAVILENLEALENLEILAIGDLLVEEPERNCPYSMPCEEDIVTAEQITCERADTLDRIALVTQELSPHPS
jgi:hypothetical protein